MRTKLLALFLTLFLACITHAQKDQPITPNLEGVWKGTSLCQVKNSSCNDEKVVYHILVSGKKDGFLIIMNKIVNNKEEDMGTVTATWDAAQKRLTGSMPNKAVWSFSIKGNTMDGTLSLADNTLYRKIHVTR